MIRCGVLAQEVSVGEAFILLAENQGEAWQGARLHTVDEVYESDWDVLILEGHAGQEAWALLMQHPPAVCPWVLTEGFAGGDGPASLLREGQLGAFLHQHEWDLPLLAENARVEMLPLAQSLLRAVGVPPGLRAMAFLPEMLFMATVQPLMMSNLKKRLYPAVARRCLMTPQAVERSLRLAVESTWDHGAWQVLRRFFGEDVHPDKGKTTNREFLQQMRFWLRQAAVRLKKLPEKTAEMQKNH